MIGRTLLDLLYPRVCAGCDKPMRDEPGHLCWDCFASMPYIAHPYCARCGDPVEGRVDEAFNCYACSEKEPHFELARSAVRYRGVLQEILRRFKYRGRLWAGAELAGLLDACVRTHYRPEEIDAVTFVPLYPVRRRERGYNQAEVLADQLARRLGKPLLRRCLARVRPTSTQTNLTAEQRATNVRGAFESRRTRQLAGRCVLLVDDVMTTGATVNECAKALKKGGAGRVVVVTVARG